MTCSWSSPCKAATNGAVSQSRSAPVLGEKLHDGDGHRESEQGEHEHRDQEGRLPRPPPGLPAKMTATP